MQPGSVCHSLTRGSTFLNSHLVFLLTFSSIIPNDLNISLTADSIWILCYSALLVWFLMDYYSFVTAKLTKFNSALIIAEEIVQKNYHFIQRILLVCSTFEQLIIGLVNHLKFALQLSKNQTCLFSSLGVFLTYVHLLFKCLIFWWIPIHHLYVPC